MNKETEDIMKKIANYIQVGKYKSGGIFGVGSKQQIIENYLKWKNLVKVSSLLKLPTHEKEITETIKSNLPEICDNEIKEIISFLDENHALMDFNEYNQNDRYSRNYLFYRYAGAIPSLVQDRIKKSTVTIIGCGGIGNHISYLLSTSGVGKITLIDDDTIELSNLTRQVLFSQNDIGRKKTEVLERELNKRNSETNIETINMFISSINDLYKIPRSDLFIVSADHPFELINWINEFCVKERQAYINIGYINDISVIGPFYIPNKTSCIKCQNIMPEYHPKDDILEHIENVNKDFKAATFPSVNGVAASYAFGDIMKYLGSFGNILSTNKRIGIHSLSIKIEEQSIHKNDKCDVCSQKQKL
ncbi:HesA/MoeB/ThiF family protein [Photorhabdus laumondii]|nr:ThiF family adenylyltransferase [Photorhabdus laumondii]